MKAAKFALLHGAVLALVAATSCLALSIESEPVKMTSQNSGPRYDIEPMLKPLIQQAPAVEQPAQQPPTTTEASPESASDDQETPIGHVAIRRIFLFPMMRPVGDSWSRHDSSSGKEESEQQQRPRENEHEEAPTMFAKPFWPFMTPLRSAPNNDNEREHHNPRRPHLYGADEASRSPPARPDQEPAASVEREGPSSMRQPMLDPIQLMVDLMHQAINLQLAPTDLSNSNGNKDDAKPSDNSPAESSEERPQLPPGVDMMLKPSGVIRPTQNETREDVVEIEGKKYLRKVVINRHVSENLIFMTKRLIFVPLNETDATTETVATTTTAPTTTSAAEATTMTQTTTPETVDRVGENKPTTVKPPLEEVTTVSSTSPSPTQRTTNQTPSSELAAVATSAGSIVESVSDMMDKAAERLINKLPSTSTTEKPQIA